eukprot:gb/GFBE01015543.1/.p1 GENE.gb/GFBE01015543.1/~~gb/GFBE01015543.1/.p1  ORF type:complete len:387 (+),score=76.24 gb/GFBE01015543.1/:1-1161(+)
MPLPAWPPPGQAPSTPVKERKMSTSSAASLASPCSSCRACGEKADMIQRLTEHVDELVTKLAAVTQERAQGAMDHSPEISQLEQCLQSVEAEVQRRRAAECSMAELDGQMQHLRERLACGERELKEQAHHAQELESQLREMRREKNETETKLAAKEAQLEMWKKQVEELSQSKRGAAKAEAIELGSPDKSSSDKKELEEQLMHKELEICNLQKQLTDELTKRQAVQWQVIEKDRLICDLQMQQSSYEESYHSSRFRFNSADLSKSLKDGPEQVDAEDTEDSTRASQNTLNSERETSSSAEVAATRKVVPQLPPWLQRYNSPVPRGGSGQSSPLPMHRRVGRVAMSQSVQVPVANFSGYGLQRSHISQPGASMVSRRVSNSARTFNL